MPMIYVDGQELEVVQGENILEACLNAGLDLPYFCWHPAMGSIGSCRQCAVVQYQNEEDTKGRIVMGCMTAVSEGARFSLKAENATEFREAVVESLMLNHPHDCPVCAEGGECHLQDMTVMVGHRDRRYTGKKNTYRNQYLGPLIHHEMNRCIACYRCERYYRDYAGGKDLGVQASHDHLYFGRHEEGVLESEFSGNLVEVCPTGVFTDKPFLKQYSRKWDLQSAPSICQGCAVGCNIAPGERYGKVKRVHNRYNNEVNGYFICDRGRFGSGYLNSDLRLDYAGIKNPDGSFFAVHQQQALDTAAGWMAGKKVAAIGSPRASIEANYLLRELVGAKNFASGFSDQEAELMASIANILQTTKAVNPSIKQIESADAVLILGEDVTNTAPRVALALRQSVRNKAFELAEQMELPAWQDAAVRNLAQDQRSPMTIVSAIDTRLDDVASICVSLAPDDIAAFGYAVAAALSGESTDNPQADAAAQMLKAAKNPLIVSGSSMAHQGVINSAVAVADALDKATSMLSFCVPECNSLGLALMVADGSGSSLSGLAKRASKLDALIILENDVYRRGDKSQIDQLLASGTKVITLDMVENSTLDQSDLVMAAASYAESQGTLVSSEGRAQRFYPVHSPAAERLPSWQWLLRLASVTGHKKLSKLQNFDQIVAACAESNPLFSGLLDVAPLNSFRDRGSKIPRQTHRYSGRTAMNSGVSVHEPQQPKDHESPLSYSMEGLNRDQPSSLMPFVWSPGWNSNQSLQKFQSEVDGPLKGGPSGVRLISSSLQGADISRQIDKVTLKAHQWHLVPMQQIHGSDELSAHTDEIAELAGRGFIAIGQKVAEKLAVTEGDGLLVKQGEIECSLEVRILSRVAKNCIGYSVGYLETQGLTAGSLVTLEADKSWQRSGPEMIASDKAAFEQVISDGGASNV
ncbi:MAG TPA: NADH-quinone oxidoreductase subunit NuoG [Porticoccaceae bacterium]|nr:NADH-quinone oxidoreductase subunit NuoG [Porticoccaceae bacterium]HIK79910.1 NADH-quinone oxidoreductase subunit NuoG [Porticoccaceae bacterium]